MKITGCIYRKSTNVKSYKYLVVNETTELLKVLSFDQHHVNVFEIMSPLKVSAIHKVIIIITLEFLSSIT